MSLTPKAILEITILQEEALKAARAGQTAVKDALLAKAATIRNITFESSDETREKYTTAVVEDAVANAGRKRKVDTSTTEYRGAFLRWLQYGEGALTDPERRDMEAGQTTITYSTGNLGGYFVPFEYQTKVFAAMAQVDPLLSSQVCDFTITDSPTLQPQQISGYDLSQIEATLISESANQAAGTFPAVSGRVLRSNMTYRMSLGASFEIEQDVPGTFSKMAVAYGVGFARRLGADAVNGNGSSQPQGLTVALPTPTVTSGYPAQLYQSDFSNLYFSCNAIHRASALAAWLMSDSVYELVRKATDSVGRPLINVENDRMELFSKPIYILPSLPVVGGSPATSSTIYFGDMSSFHIRCSRPTLQRAINTPNYAENAKALYVSRIRMDSAYFDPSNGAVPPIVSMLVQA